MELYKIRGGNKEDLENKKYTLSVGISLGNKWFTILLTYNRQRKGNRND